VIESPVTELLNSHSIPFDVVTIPLSDDKKPIRNLEELLESQGRDPQSIVRSLVFKTKSGKFVLLAVTGNGRADWATLRKHLGERKLRMAEFDEIEHVTGYIVGAVPPIALPENIHILVDNSINRFDRVIIGSGVLGYALSLLTTDLLMLLTDADTGPFISQ